MISVRVARAARTGAPTGVEALEQDLAQGRKTAVPGSFIRSARGVS